MFNQSFNFTPRFRKAAIGAAFLLIGAPILIYAQKNQENYKDLIAKAENLSLQRDRLKAVQVLAQGISREKKNSAPWMALKASLDQLAGLFYADKTQRVFEMAESLYFSDSAQSLPKYNEALSLEPDNLEILLATARANINQNQCRPALEAIQRAIVIHPWSETSEILRLTALTCGAGATEKTQFATRFEITELANKVLFFNLQGRWRIKDANRMEAQEVLTKARDLDPQFPETYFWLHKAVSEPAVKSLEYAEKYLQLCQGIDSKLRRRYVNAPQLCQSTAEAESFINGVKSREEF